MPSSFADLIGELEHLRSASNRRYAVVGFRGGHCWRPVSDRVRVLAAEPGSTRLELDDGHELEALIDLARAPGDNKRVCVEPPTLSDLFHEAVGR